jgi:hypothetical protein
MRITLLIDKGRLGGVSLTGAERELPAGGPRAHLVAGPGQELREVDVPDDVIPRTEAGADVDRFFTFLTTKFLRATKHPRPKKRTR